ncbi:unnamed protein product [Urochloa humidicola]
MVSSSARRHLPCPHLPSIALAPGTLHRAVSYVNGFLSTTAVTSAGDFTQLLLGAVAVFAAAKYEDSRAADVLTTDALSLCTVCTHGPWREREREAGGGRGSVYSGRRGMERDRAR